MEAQLSNLRGGSQPVFMTASELMSSQFPVFRHRQLCGDLLIIPPRWYVFGVEAVHYPDRAVVLRRISAKDCVPLSHGHACQFMV